MATIQSFTSLEQSKKLAEILPLESADMHYQYVLPKSDKIKHNPEIGNPINALEWYNKGYTTFGKEPITLDEYCVPCWSLAALLDILPPIEEFRPIIDLDINSIRYEGNYRDELCFSGNNLVDVCYEMIIKLHEKGLL